MERSALPIQVIQIGVPSRQHQTRRVLRGERGRPCRPPSTGVLLTSELKSMLEQRLRNTISCQQPHESIERFECQGLDQRRGILRLRGSSRARRSVQLASSLHGTPHVHATPHCPGRSSARQNRAAPTARCTPRGGDPVLRKTVSGERSTPDAPWGANPSPGSIRPRFFSSLRLPIPWRLSTRSPPRR